MPARISDLDAHLGYWLRFVSNHVSQTFASRLQGKGVTVAEWWPCDGFSVRAVWRPACSPSELV